MARASHRDIDRTRNETRLYLDGRLLSTTKSDFFDGGKLFHGRVPIRVATNSYVARYQARLIPEISGSYTLWIASGDESELRLSSDESPENKRAIASVPGYSEINRWDKFASMKSTTIELIAGRRYYIEAVMRQGSGDSDNLSVAWLPPDGVRTVIPGRNLECVR